MLVEGWDECQVQTPMARGQAQTLERVGDGGDFAEHQICCYIVC
jgi:hypothetical protein